MFLEYYRKYVLDSLGVHSYTIVASIHFAQQETTV